MAAVGSMGWRAFGAPARKQRKYLDTTWWDPYVENITDVDTYLRRKFRQDVTDKTTGIGIAEIRKELFDLVKTSKAAGDPWRMTKAKCFAHQIRRQSIDVSPLDWFPAIAIWNRDARPFYNGGILWRRRDEVNKRSIPKKIRDEWEALKKSGNWWVGQDFCHSVPDWRVILALGFPGMKARLERYAVKGDPFYDSLVIAMDAILAGIDRFIEQGKKRLSAPSAPSGPVEIKSPPSAALSAASQLSGPSGLSKLSREATLRGEAPLRAEGPLNHLGGEAPLNRLTKEIACLERLRNGPPQTAYDMMMFVWIYFFFSEHIDGIQCRSLTELDVFLTPYYEADLAAGRTTEAEFREHLKHFLWQWGSINNYWNQPVGFGGTRKDGSSEFNHVSKIILDVVDECNLTTPKFLVKIAPNTPDWAMDKLLDMARRHRSVTFVGEMSTARALKKWYGASDEDCRTMVMRGCYEFSLADSANNTGVGAVNFLKIVEQMLDDARQGKADWPDFEAFKAEFLARLVNISSRTLPVIRELEKVLEEINPTCCMTLSTEHALKTGQDAFSKGCPRGNHSSICQVGVGTTVDALLAVKELVYEKRELTLKALGEIMAANWEGHEKLRLRMLRSKRKWGNNDPEANALGATLLKAFGDCINGKPNSRGGVFLASGHNARGYLSFGKGTGATPDGRKKGEEMSKNLSPTMGADTEGATALVATLASSDTTVLPEDYPLDVMLHPSVCAGQKGLEVMKALVREYHKNGGGVIQFTVFSAEELRDAQAHPEKYENLQVRVCGWNVRWNDMCKTEQDAYIRRAENIMQAY